MEMWLVFFRQSHIAIFTKHSYLLSNIELVTEWKHLSITWIVDTLSLSKSILITSDNEIY